VLPLLRRTFSTFPPAERRQMGRRVNKGPRSPAASRTGEPSGERFDHDRAAKVLPLVRQILGISEGGAA